MISPSLSFPLQRLLYFVNELKIFIKEGDMNIIEIYTDGSCINNQRKYNKQAGAAAVVLIRKNGNIIKKKILSWKLGEVSNNYAELIAVKNIIMKLNLPLIEKEKWKVIIYTDSEYVVNTFNEWIYYYEKNGWKLKTKKEKSVKYKDLIKGIWTILKKSPYIEIRKIKAHSGNIYNELADKYARKSALS